MPSIASKRFSLLHIGITSVALSLFTAVLVYLWVSHTEAKKIAENTTPKYCNYNIKRITGLKFVKPILWVDEECESDNMIAIKQKMAAIIEKYKQFEGVSTASVYLRTAGEWTVVNPEEKYLPGSLFKVPILITILRMEEESPGFLNKVVPYTKSFPVDKNVSFASKTIQLGQNYTIKELLSYMIKYSDNAATILLEQYMDVKMMQRLFADVGVAVPNSYSSQYFFTVRDYSLFMRTIFNAGYLTIPDSEFAAELLSECDFKEGIMKGIPAGTKIAHKFGESGSPAEKQLHESAVIYLENTGYLITVMTKGKDFKKLSDLIGELSRAVYEDAKSKSN